MLHDNGRFFVLQSRWNCYFELNITHDWALMCKHKEKNHIGLYIHLKSLGRVESFVYRGISSHPASTGNHMVEGTRKMYTWFSRHIQEVAKERLYVNT